jgi:hypothetical protein
MMTISSTLDLSMVGARPLRNTDHIEQCCGVVIERRVVTSQKTRQEKGDRRLWKHADHDAEIVQTQHSTQTWLHENHDI